MIGFTRIGRINILRRSLGNVNKQEELLELRYNKYADFSINDSQHMNRLLINVNNFAFCRTKSYIDQYNNLQHQVQQKRNHIKQLKQKLSLLQKMSEMSATDHILKGLFLLVGNKSYQSSAFKQHKQMLIDLRNQLQQKIQESSIKWEEPRKQITQEREKRIEEFLVKLIDYEEKMAWFIKKRENQKEKHLADINQGLVMTHNMLIRNIEKEGGVVIRPEAGDKFNEQVNQIFEEGNAKKSIDKKELIIKQMIMHGWKLKDQVIRKAKVLIK